MLEWLKWSIVHPFVGSLRLKHCSGSVNGHDHILNPLKQEREGTMFHITID